MSDFLDKLSDQNLNANGRLVAAIEGIEQRDAEIERLRAEIERLKEDWQGHTAAAITTIENRDTEIEKLRAEIVQLEVDLVGAACKPLDIEHRSTRRTFLDAAKMATGAVKAWQEDADLQSNEEEKHECLCRADAVRQFGMDLRRAAEGVKDATELQTEKRDA